jgi:monoterpene epsilon-lactone hydrolase
MLAEQARKAGVEVRLEVFEGMLHTFQMAAGRAPEADDAIGKLADSGAAEAGLVTTGSRHDGAGHRVRAAGRAAAA